MPRMTIVAFDDGGKSEGRYASNTTLTVREINLKIEYRKEST